MSRPTQISRFVLSIRGCHPLRPGFPAGSGQQKQKHWPDPRSLATTNGVLVDVLSSGYLDVSVPRVRSYSPMISENKSLLLISVGPKTARSAVVSSKTVPCSRPVAPKVQPVRPSFACPCASSEQQRSKVGFPIRRFPDQSLFAAPRDLSQRTTSFIASQRQGIHQIPLRHLIALIAKARLFDGSLIDSEDRKVRLLISVFDRRRLA